MIKVVLAALVLLAVVGMIFMAGVLGSLKSMNDPAVMEAKPWQPIARLGLSFVMMTLTLIFGGAFIKTSIR